MHVKTKTRLVLLLLDFHIFKKPNLWRTWSMKIAIQLLKMGGNYEAHINVTQQTNCLVVCTNSFKLVL